jgi:hypothetical protein
MAYKTKKGISLFEGRGKVPFIFPAAVAVAEVTR